MGNAYNRKKNKSDNIDKRPGIGKYVIAAVATAGLLAFGAYEFFFGNNIYTNHDNKSDIQTSVTSRYSIDQVISGIITPQQYVQELFDTFPEAQNARRNGGLKGFIYDPSQEEFRRIFTENYDHRPIETLRFGEIFNRSIRCFKEADEDKESPAFTTSPTFGIKIPRYVVFKRGFFTKNFFLRNDEDVKGIVSHELQHVKDLYDGITLGNEHLDYGSFKKGIRIKFLDSLAEFRAYGKQVKSFVEVLVKTGRYSESEDYIKHTCLNYLDYRNKLESFPANQLENDLRNFQFAEFSGISMVETDTEYLLSAMYESKTVEIKLAKKRSK